MTSLIGFQDIYRGAVGELPDTLLSRVDTDAYTFIYEPTVSALPGTILNINFNLDLWTRIL